MTGEMALSINDSTFLGFGFELILYGTCNPLQCDISHVQPTRNLYPPVLSGRNNLNLETEDPENITVLPLFLLLSILVLHYTYRDSFPLYVQRPGED